MAQTKARMGGADQHRMVESTREMNGKISKEKRFYITSLSANAKEFAEAVRALGH